MISDNETGSKTDLSEMRYDEANESSEDDVDKAI